ncbi:hypothetical protein [Streptomyces sp. NPDC058671]
MDPHRRREGPRLPARRARVQATLMQLTTGKAGLPTPEFLAVTASAVELR